MVFPFVGSDSGVVAGSNPDGWSAAAKDLLGDGHRGHRLRPPGVEGQVRDHLDELGFAGAVLLGETEVVAELLGVPARRQGSAG
jgi:hypothetical protein